MVLPNCSPDPEGPKYEQYCRQKLMQHVPFRQQEELLDGNETSSFLLSGSVPSALDYDLCRLHQQIVR